MLVKRVLTCSLLLGVAKMAQGGQMKVKMADLVNMARRAGSVAADNINDLLSLSQRAWWTNGVVYNIVLSSFKDSDGDGYGDVNGIRQKLDYLQSLNVDGVMINPPFRYPGHGPGYSLKRTRLIDPIYGNMDDMRKLIAELHVRGMHVILDFVPNRLSAHHSWFIKSTNKEGKYTDFFIWKPATSYDEDGDPIPPYRYFDVNDRNVWVWSERRQEFYLAHATELSPVLKLDNPVITQQIMENMVFWLDNGADGFRVDALEFLCGERNFQSYIDKNPNWNAQDRTKITLSVNYNLPDKCRLAKLFGDKVGEYIKADKKPRVLLVESFGGVDEQIRHYHGESIDGNPRFMIPINIQMLETMNQGSQANEIKDLIDSWLENMIPGDIATWILGSPDTGHMASKVGSEMVGALNMMLMTLPGLVVVHQGQEIGVTNHFVRQDLSRDTYALLAPPGEYLKHSRDFFRTPMQWDHSDSAGFSSNRTTWLPVNPNYFCVNVDNEEKDRVSELKTFREIASIRRTVYPIKYGKVQIFSPEPNILVIKRYLENHPSYILVINTDLMIKEAFISGYGPHPDGDIVRVVMTSRNSDIQPGMRLIGPLYPLRLLPRTAVLLRTTTLFPKQRGQRRRVLTKIDTNT